MFEPTKALSPGGFGPASTLLLRLLLCTTVAAIGPSARASNAGDDVKAAPRQPSAESRQQAPQGNRQENHQADENQQTKQDHEPERSAASNAQGVCDALATAATSNDLPVDFVTRLIWQESRFKPDAISRKGAQGIAQFMPTTARASGLENPFDPLEAIAKSGELLRDLRREFGNLGLAAAAYNAGSGRVHDWLGGRRPLPSETRAYVRIVTGRSVEDWAGGQANTQANPVRITPAGSVNCNLLSAALTTRPDTAPPRPETVNPWGVQVVGGPTPAKALARYREWLPKYAALVAGREPHIVIRGNLGQMGAALVRVGADTRAGAEKLCAALKAAGTYCDVLRN